MPSRRPVVSLAVVVVALGMFGCGPNQPAQPTGGGTPTQPAVSPSTPSGPTTNPSDPTTVDFKLTVPTYRDEYEKDRQGTQKKYDGKWVEVSGRFGKFTRTADGTELTIDEPEWDKHAFLCEMKNGEPWKTALPGQTIQVRGKVSGVFPTLQLKNATVLSATGAGPATVTAAEVAKEFKANSDEFNKKHETGSYLILTGVIASVAAEEASNSVVISLTQESEGAVVKCSFSNLNPVDKAQNAKLAKGQKVKVLGRNRSIISCNFAECVLLDEKK